MKLGKRLSQGEVVEEPVPEQNPITESAPEPRTPAPITEDADDRPAPAPATGR